MWFEDETGVVLIGAPGGTLEPVDPADPRFGPIDPEDGLPTTIDGYEKLPPLGTIRYLSELERSTITGPLGQIRITELGEATIAEQKYTYDASRDVLIDNETGVVYVNDEGFFTAPMGLACCPALPCSSAPTIVAGLHRPRHPGPVLRRVHLDRSCSPH